MADQDINLRVRNQDAKKAVEEVNRALGQTEQAEKRILEVTSKSQSVLERQLRTLERRAALAGKTGADKLMAERDLVLGRFGGDANAINRVTAAYDKLIAAANRAPVQQTESFFGAFLKAEVAIAGIEKLGGAMKALIVDTARYAASTELYTLAARSIATANGIAAQSVDRLMSTLGRMGITQQNAAQGISQAIASRIGMGPVQSLARLGQDLAVTNPSTTSSDAFNRLIYGIQSAQTDVLRTVGLNVNFESAYRQFAQANKRTVESLSEQEKIQIRTNTVLQQGSRYAGLYEESLSTVGKQMQSLDRLTKEASNAIGERFLPVLGAIVRTASALASGVAESPRLANSAAITLSTGGGAAIGAAIGGGIGALAGGAGAIPGAALGAKIGGGLGLVGGTGSIFYDYYSSRIDVAGMNRRVQRMMGTEPGRALEEEARLNAQVSEQNAKAMNAARAAQDALTNARIAEMDGLDKVLAEYDQVIDSLKREGLLTKELAKTYRELAVYKFNAQLIQPEFQRQQEEWLEREEAALKMMKERTDAEVALFEFRRAQVTAAQVERGRGMENLGIGRIEDRIAGIRDERELAMLRADTEAEKLAVTLDFIEREKAAQLDLLNFKTEIQRREIAIRYAGNEQAIRLMNELIDAEVEASTRRLEKAAAAGADSAKLATLKNEQRQIQDAYQRTFDSIQRSAEGLFDALIVGGRNFADMLRRTLLVGLLTPIKQAFSSFVATALIGQRAAAASAVGVAPIGGGGGLGAFGALAPLVGGPGGTGGFAGPVGGGGFGGFAGLGGGLAGSLSRLGNIGMGRGPVFARDGVMSQNIGGGIGGWQGGALLAGGGVLGAIGLQRGGWSGLAMTTAGGAMIGAKFGGPVGAAIGAGVGAAAGFIRMLFKGKDQKIIDEVRKLYAVTIDRQFARALADQSRGQDLRVFLSSPGVREQVEIYASYTGQRMNALNNIPRGVNLAQSGGGLTQTGSFIGNIGYSYGGAIGALPGLTPFAAGAASGPVILDAAETRQFWSDAVERGIVQNPRAVQSASNAATAQSFGRISAAVNLTDPLAARI